VLKAGDVLTVGGQPYTVLEDTFLGFGDNEQAGGCYWLAGTPFERITNDEQAWALGMYGSTNGVLAKAQAGIADWRKTQFDDPVVNIVKVRTQPMKTFLDHGISLDGIDQIALEYRAQPHLNALATAFGWPDWQHMLADVVHDEWQVFNIITTHGSLHDFALQNGYPTMYAYRAAMFATYEDAWSQVRQAAAWAAAEDAAYEQAAAAAQPVWQSAP
jgi:hypothetical protein